MGATTRWRLTQGGRVAVGLGVLLYLASLTSLSSLLLLIDGLLLGVLLVNGVWAWRSVQALELVLPERVRAVEGRSPEVAWLVRNRSRKWAGLVEVVVGGSVVLRLGAVAPGHEVRVRADGLRLRRGVHDLSRATLRSAWPFGLAICERPGFVRGSVWVMPAVYAVEAPVAGGYDAMVGGRYRGGGRLLSGTQVSGIRPFQDGDSLRQVHWKASARGRGWMVKTFEEELSGRVAILGDGGGGVGESARDDAVRAAGSLLLAALDAGHHVEWRDLAEAETTLHPPFADAESILEGLAALGTRSAEATTEAWRAAAEGCSRRSALAVVTAKWTPALRAAVGAWISAGRNVTVYLRAGEMCADLPAGCRLQRFGADAISVA